MSDDEEFWARLARDLDEDEEAFLAEWDAAEQSAVQLLRVALRDAVGEPPPEPDLRQAANAIRDGVRRGGWPHVHIATAAGWREGPRSTTDSAASRRQVRSSP